MRNNLKKQIPQNIFFFIKLLVVVRYELFKKIGLYTYTYIGK